MHFPDVKKLEYVPKKYKYNGRGQLEYGLILVIVYPERYQQVLGGYYLFHSLYNGIKSVSLRRSLNRMSQVLIGLSLNGQL